MDIPVDWARSGSSSKAERPAIWAGGSTGAGYAFGKFEGACRGGYNGFSMVAG